MINKEDVVCAVVKVYCHPPVGVGVYKDIRDGKVDDRFVRMVSNTSEWWCTSGDTKWNPSYQPYVWDF